MAKRSWAVLLVGLLAVGCGDSDAAPNEEPTELSECDRAQLEEFDECKIDYSSDESSTAAMIEAFCASSCDRADALVVNDTDLRDLSFAHGVTELDGALVVEHNEQLRSLQGLDELKKLNFGENEISFNPRLRNLKGLDSLTSVRSYLSFHYNGIETLEGLESLEEVERGLVFQNNSSLTTLRALESLERVGGLVLMNNEKLPQCEIDWLLDRIEVEGETQISNNGGATDAECDPQ